MVGQWGQFYFCWPLFMIYYGIMMVHLSWEQTEACVAQLTCIQIQMDNYSLYLDHQAIAPLVRYLEEIVDSTQKDQQYEFETHEIRQPIYKEFVRILHEVYQESDSSVKEEDMEMDIEQRMRAVLPRVDVNAFREAIGRVQAQHKKSKAPQQSEKLEMELKLVDWVIAEDKCVFPKKEIDDKMKELGGSKRPVPMKKLVEMLRKYHPLSHLILVARNGEQHLVGRAEPSEEPTEEEVKKEQEYDSNIIRPPSSDHSETEDTVTRQEIAMVSVKEEPKAEGGSVQVFQQENPLPDYVRQSREERVELKASIYDSEEESLHVGDLNQKQ